jgi:hypothetical protein
MTDVRPTLRALSGAPAEPIALSDSALPWSCGTRRMCLDWVSGLYSTEGTDEDCNTKSAVRVSCFPRPLAR